MSGVTVVSLTARRQLRYAWAAVIALSLILVVAISYCEKVFRDNLAAYHAAQRANSDKWTAALQQLVTEARDNPLLLNIQDGDTPSRLRHRNRDELAESLFPGQPPTDLPGSSSSAVRWSDPKRDMVIEFEFGPDGTWRAYDPIMPRIDTPPTLPWLLRGRAVIEPYRRLWVGWLTPFTIGPMLWIALVFTSMFWRRAAYPLAHGHAAVAWLCFIGWLLNPNYSLTVHGISSNPMLMWGVLMVITSCVMLSVVAARTPARDPSRCSACGYDLTGNVSGVCPECGLSITEPAPEPAPA